MQSIKLQNVFLFLFLLVESVLSLPQCAEFLENNEQFQQQLHSFEEQLNDYEELNEYFNATNNMDFETMNDVLNSLEADDSEDLIHGTKSVLSQIIKENYPAEAHSVVTDDGYILTMHRIPYSPKSPQSSKPKQPVFLMHGLWESSNGWIVLGAEHALAFKLADAGYDVWMGNARGTESSGEHVSLNQKDKSYWSFSWHEIGYYDLPACIDYILNKTNHKKLLYIGYSQGTTSFLVLTTMRPEYNDKIIEANLLAPVAFLKGNTNTIYSTILYFYKPLNRLLSILNINHVSVNNIRLLKIVELACRKAPIHIPFGCEIVLSIIGSNQINCTILPRIVQFTPAGASLRQGIHYVQLMRDDGFRQFDYDESKLNEKHYGRPTPPDYDLSNVKTPVNLLMSSDDGTATLENSLKLKSHLPNVKQTYIVPVNDFVHVDFIYSRFAPETVNEKLIFLVNKANENYQNTTKSEEYF